MDERATVVVGVDGSAESRAALQFAVVEAARRGGGVRAVRVFVPVEYWAGEWGVSAREVTAEIEADLLRQMRAEVDAVRASRPGLTPVPVEVRALPGSPPQVLVEQSRTADLLVVGHRGHGPLASVMLGSVALRCVRAAECAVTVVRSGAQERVTERSASRARGRVPDVAPAPAS
jgi:nucleotide-binding universal stress UspA family protein